MPPPLTARPHPNRAPPAAVAVVVELFGLDRAPVNESAMVFPSRIKRASPRLGTGSGLLSCKQPSRAYPNGRTGSLGGRRFMLSRLICVLIIIVSRWRAIAPPLPIVGQYTRYAGSCQVPNDTPNLKSSVRRTHCGDPGHCMPRYRTPSAPLSPRLAY